MLNGNSRPNNKGVAIIIDRLPRNLRNQFKAACAKRGISMRDALLKFIRDTITDNVR